MSLKDRYSSLVAQGRIEDDPAQRACIVRLAQLARELRGYVPAPQRGFLDRLLARTSNVPRGLYIWGAVGRGKTMLMDMFFARAEIEPKRRVHFHAFMADVHARIHKFRQSQEGGAGDPAGPVAAALAQEAALLCFDEFVVTDIADAMLLGRLFQALFAAGVVVVATSNVPPQQLYKDGLNRSLFLPFIVLLEQRLDIMELAARTDFRLEKLAGAPVWHVPADAAASNALNAMFAALTGEARGAPRTLSVLGRAIPVPQAALGVARFSFADLCELPLGGAEYLAIAREYHTLILDSVPVIAPDNRNAARRFITLIDTLYDHRVKLVASAAAQPQALYAASEGREAFEFQRTASRLIDMRSRDYLAHAHGRRGAVDATGIAET